MLSLARTLSVSFAVFALQASALSQIRTEELKVAPPDLRRLERFGFSVAISGERVFAGRYGAPDPILGLPRGGRPGLVRVHDRITGQVLDELIAGDAAPNDGFGFKLAAVGSHLLVGAVRAQGTPGGAAYLFDAQTGQQLHKFQPRPGAGSPFDGWSLAIGLDSARAIVGVPRESSAANLAGAAYVFDLGTGQQQLRLAAPTATDEAYFGSHVAIGGGLAAVASPGDTAVYVYDSGTGQLLHTLTTPPPGTGSALGGAVAIEGTLVIAGTSDAVHVFDGITGQLVISLTPPGGTSPLFGWSLAANSGRLAVSEPFSDTAGYGSGSIHVFDISTGQRTTELVSSSPTLAFALAVAYDGDHVVAGDAWDSSTAGQAGAFFVFDDAPTNSGGGTCYADGVASACPCAQVSPSSGCPNSVDLGPEFPTTGAILYGAGDAVIASDSLVLNATNLPAHAPGLFVQGSLQAPMPAGEGQLCISGAARYPVQTASASGRVSRTGLSLQAAPGATLTYQFWYRDPANACGLAGFNFTNAWTVTW